MWLEGAMKSVCEKIYMSTVITFHIHSFHMISNTALSSFVKPLVKRFTSYKLRVSYLSQHPSFSCIVCIWKEKVTPSLIFLPYFLNIW